MKNSIDKHSDFFQYNTEMDNKDKMNDDIYLRNLVGKFFMVGFEGTSVTKEITLLITKYHISSIILSGRNFINASQAKTLIHNLQTIAIKSDYDYPIIFVIDEEGGMLNSLFDKDYITQFPGAMSLGATGSVDLVYNVYKAMAKELRSIGFSMYLGPVLDILNNTSNTLLQQMIGVRSFGYDIESVIKYGEAAARAFKDEKMPNCGKHFPGYGSATVNSNFELPMIFETTDQLLKCNLVPYAKLIENDLLDSIMVGGCAVPNVNNNDLHACLSPTIVTNILREKLKFNGVVISECLLLEALDRNFGVVQGCISAFSVGCDLIMLCNNYEIQEQAIRALKSVIHDQLIDNVTLQKSAERIEKLQKSLPPWQEVLALSGFLNHDILHHHHLLSRMAYEKSITVIRDTGLPITKYLMPNVEDENTILLLTPLISPLYETVDGEGNKSHINNLGPNDKMNLKLHYGEDVFIKFGELLSNHKPGYKVFHTSYNSNGLTSFHEELILKSKVILFFCAETTNNLYQVGVSKHVSMLCGSMSSKITKNHDSFNNRQMIIISVSSPTDFIYDINIGGSPTGYICTYDYTINALCHLPKILFGESTATGKIPGLKTNNLNNVNKVSNPSTFNKVGTHSWLVETFNFKRDWRNFISLLKNNNYLNFSVKEGQLTSLKRLYADSENHKSFVVRNTSSNSILGISTTWVYFKSDEKKNKLENNIGNLMFLLVEENKRNISIGSHLYSKTIKYLLEECSCAKIYLARDFPKITIFNDILLNFNESNNNALRFFKSFGWTFTNNVFCLNTNIHKSSKKRKSISLGLDHSNRISINTMLAENNDIQMNRNNSNSYNTNNRNINHHKRYNNNNSDNETANTYPNSKDLSTTFNERDKYGSSVNNESNNSKIWDEFSSLILNRSMKRQIRYLMKLDEISNWKVAENLVRQLQVVGVMFDICKNPSEIFSLKEGRNNNISFENNKISICDYDINQLSEFSSNNYEIYLELFRDSCKNKEDRQYMDSSGNLDIIVALEPTKRSVVGSLVVFNGKSKFAKFYPFLESSINDRKSLQEKKYDEFSCITGHYIDPLYSTLSEVFKLGLICTALMYIKGQYKNCSECFITDIDEKQIRSLHDNGFKTVEKYYNYYSVIANV